MNEKLLAQKENLLVLDDWTALFSSPTETIMIDGSENCSNFLLYKVVKCNLKPKKKTNQDLHLGWLLGQVIHISKSET